MPWMVVIAREPFVPPCGERERTPAAHATSIDRACASSPSARASVVIVPASRRNPAAVTRCVDTSLTKSAACRPPRPRATPAVGSV